MVFSPLSRLQCDFHLMKFAGYSNSSLLKVWKFLINNLERLLKPSSATIENNRHLHLSILTINMNITNWIAKLAVLCSQSFDNAFNSLNQSQKKSLRQNCLKLLVFAVLRPVFKTFKLKVLIKFVLTGAFYVRKEHNLIKFSNLRQKRFGGEFHFKIDAPHHTLCGRYT